MIDKNNLINNTQSYGGVWILAEVAGKAIDKVSFELLSRGRQLADARSTELSAVVLGWRINQSDLEELIARGADKVIFVESPQLEHFLVEPHSACLLELIKQYRPEILIAAATTTGRTLMPYLAVRARAGLTADCTELKIDKETGGLLQIRPAIGGNVLATIITPAARPQMATVRPRSTKPAPMQKGRTGEIVRINPPADLLKSCLQRLGFESDQSTHSIQDADIIVAVGRGIGNARNIRIVEELADALDAAIGASREVVDRGWLGYPHQVGLSGKTVTPKLYIAIGISGAVQHLAGMQTAETIVAINEDPQAPIFTVADFGIIGDLFEIVPALTERVRQARKK
ncbi:MAG: electron transfer flavoprotein subunit alpha/FixB family protein [Planctomycetes bacterium]|nr:electron transfer flavoprotein subunit alpha/FixB family protein [Planctomycetota bacterium]